MKEKYLKILAPFTSIRDVKLLKEAGADELYCGYVTEELAQKWPLAFNLLNRRGESESFNDYKVFGRAIEEAERYNLAVYVTINGLYTPEQYPALLELVEKVECLKGVKGVIVADTGLLLTLKKNRFKKEIHISTGGTSFNSNTVDFYRNLGVDRVILPRQLTAYEIGDIVTEIGTKIDIEIFVIREGCGGFIDGYCTFFHCFERKQKEKIKKGFFLKPSYNTEQATKGCQFYFIEELARGRFKTFSANSYKEKEKNLKFSPKKYNLEGCRICDLYYLHKYPIKSLKIIGRGQDARVIVKCIKLISKALSYLKSNAVSRRDYQRKCKGLFSKIVYDNKSRCAKYECYFSPHWVRNGK